MIENKKYYDIEVDALFEKGCTTIDDCFYLKFYFILLKK